MEREEAIRRIKAWNLDSDDIEVLSVAIPELRESEDEKIRKDIIQFFRDVSNSKTRVIDTNTFAEWAEYLVKQKKLFEQGRGLYYYDGEKTIYCGYPATEENPYDLATARRK